MEIAASLAWVVVWNLLALPAFSPGLAPALSALWLLAVATAFAWLHLGGRAGSKRRRVRYRVRPLGPGAAWLIPMLPVLVLVQLSLATLLFSLGIVTETAETGPIEELLDRRAGMLLVALLAVVVAPLTEEFFFRGRIQRALERWDGPVWAIAATSMLFAWIHFDPAGVPNRFVGGCVLGFAVYATRSIWSGVILHAGWNGGLLLLTSMVGDRASDKATDLQVITSATVLLLASALTLVWVGQKLWLASAPARSRAPASRIAP